MSSTTSPYVVQVAQGLESWGTKEIEERSYHFHEEQFAGQLSLYLNSRDRRSVFKFGPRRNTSLSGRKPGALEEVPKMIRTFVLSPPPYHCTVKHAVYGART